jgi:CRP/FNR family transcriptional regulator, nitrogen fixation regulation protein
LVDQGSLWRFRLMSGDRRSIRQFLFPGDGFGYEIGRHHRDTVQALTPIKVLAVARDALLAAATTDARLSNLLFSAAASAAEAADERADMMLVKNAAERIAQFLLEMEIRLSTRGVIDLPMSRSQIGDYFGVRIETVSRTFSAFQKEKIIQFRDRKQRQMVICDKRRLQQLASDASDFDYWSILKRRKSVNGRRLVAKNEARETLPPAPSQV